VLQAQSIVRRAKMVKLNNLYFTSQIKDLIFYQKEQSGEGSP